MFGGLTIPIHAVVVQRKSAAYVNRERLQSEVKYVPCIITACYDFFHEGITVLYRTFFSSLLIA